MALRVRASRTSLPRRVESPSTHAGHDCSLSRGVQARRRRHGRRLRRDRRTAPASRRPQDGAWHRAISGRASASGARRARRPACLIPTCASCTRSAKPTASCSLPWSCSRANRCRHGSPAGRFRSLESVDITLAVLSALEAIHARGIVHRDLKPSNIFLTPHGIKLLDFGLARAVQDVNEQTQAGITMAGTVVGTPHYMSPEQLSGRPVGRALRSVRRRRHTLRTARGRHGVSRRRLPPRCSTPSCTSHCPRSMDPRRSPPSTGSCIGRPQEAGGPLRRRRRDGAGASCRPKSG